MYEYDSINSDDKGTMRIGSNIRSLINLDNIYKKIKHSNNYVYNNVLEDFNQSQELYHNQEWHFELPRYYNPEESFILEYNVDVSGIIRMKVYDEAAGTLLGETSLSGVLW